MRCIVNPNVMSLERCNLNISSSTTGEKHLLFEIVQCFVLRHSWHCRMEQSSPSTKPCLLHVSLEAKAFCYLLLNVLLFVCFVFVAVSREAERSSFVSSVFRTFWLAKMPFDIFQSRQFQDGYWLLWTFLSGMEGYQPFCLRAWVRCYNSVLPF